MALRDEFANVKTRRKILVARIYDFSAKIASLRLLNPRQKSQIRRQICVKRLNFIIKV